MGVDGVSITRSRHKINMDWDCKRIW